MMVWIPKATFLFYLRMYPCYFYITVGVFNGSVSIWRVGFTLSQKCFFAAIIFYLQPSQHVRNAGCLIFTLSINLSFYHKQKSIIFDVSILCDIYLHFNVFLSISNKQNVKGYRKEEKKLIFITNKQRKT